MHSFDLTRLIRLVAASEPFRRDSRAEFEITERHEETWAALLGAPPATQIEAAYLATLTRRPTAVELAHFTARLRDREGRNPQQALEDLHWKLVNSTEFTWNH